MNNAALTGGGLLLHVVFVTGDRDRHFIRKREELRNAVCERKSRRALRQAWPLVDASRLRFVVRLTCRIMLEAFERVAPRERASKNRVSPSFLE